VRFRFGLVYFRDGIGGVELLDLDGLHFDRCGSEVQLIDRNRDSYGLNGFEKVGLRESCLEI